MRHLFPRILIALSATILTTGGAIHAASFPRARVALGGSRLPSHLVGAFQMLWLADSTTLISIALVLAYISLRPEAVPRPLVFGIALVPAATTALLFWFLGPVPAAAMLAVATVAAVGGGICLPGSTLTQ